MTDGHTQGQSIYRASTASRSKNQTLYNENIWPGTLHGTVSLRLRSVKCIQGDSDVILMPAGFRRHLVCKTPINVFHCDIALLASYRSDHTDTIIN